MLAIIGYMLLSIIAAALLQTAKIRKTLLWDWIGCIPLLGCILFSVAFAQASLEILLRPQSITSDLDVAAMLIGTNILIAAFLAWSFYSGRAIHGFISNTWHSRRGQQGHNIGQ